MFTRLLPNKTEPIRRSLSSVILSARSAPFEPLSAWARSLPRDAAVSAVSEPENRPESTRRQKIIPLLIQKALSSIAGAVSICENTLCDC